jgi:hypothetical protein
MVPHHHPQLALSIVTLQSKMASQCHVTVTTSRRVIMTDRNVAATAKLSPGHFRTDNGHKGVRDLDAL